MAAGDAGVVVSEELMAAGSWSAVLDFTEERKALLWDAAHKRPYKWHACVYDSDDNLVYPPLLLLTLVGDEEGLTIGGTGPIWHLGTIGVGPLIIDREHVAGTNKLDNGDFGDDWLYWRRASEDSMWDLSGGVASNVGGRSVDDVLEYDRKFPVRGGQVWRIRAEGVTGSGFFRGRIIFEGEFNPPDFWINGNLALDDAGWTEGTYVEIVNDPANAYDPATSESVIRCSPIPKPQLNPDPGLETGTPSWTDVSEFPTDMEIVEDPANAYEGDFVMRAGPVTQKQLLLNPDMELGSGTTIPNWYPSSITAGVATEPDPVWYSDAGGGVNGSTAATTDGAATTGIDIKYLRSDSSDGSSGVQAYDVVPGERYEAEVELRDAPSTDGYAYLSLVFPHPTLEPLHHRWSTSQTHEGDRNSTDEFRRYTVGDTVPAGRTKVYVLIEVHDHTTGYTAADNATLTRTAGNRAKIVCDDTFPIETDARYEVAAMLRADGEMQVGSVRAGVILEGVGMVDQTEGDDRGGTDFVWDRAAKEFRPPSGYTDARLFVSAQDILGAPVWIDWITLTKLDNNRDHITAQTLTLVPERTYTVNMRVRSGPLLQRGNVRLECKFMRAGYPDITVESQITENTQNEWKDVPFSITPPSGYDQASRRVVFTDVEGDNFYASHFSIRDADTGTMVFDGGATDPTDDDIAFSAAPPQGAESVRVAIVVAAGTTDWTMDAVHLFRTDGTPATGNAIVARFLKDPDTNDPLSIDPGTIDCPETLPYDWLIQNMPNLSALNRYCSVVSEPPREWKLNPIIPPTIDVAISEDVFTDHPDIVLLPRDIDVEDLADPATDVTDRATVIQLIGAEFATISGAPFRITAFAQVPGAPEYDIKNRVIKRTKQISDATIDNARYAQAYADDLALQEANPALALDFTLTGNDTRPPFDVGDWLYVYHPESGLENPDNPVPIEGETVYPQRVRVLGRQREHGPSFHIVMLRSDGTTFPLDGVRWSERDATRLTVGDRRPLEWEADPQGGSVGYQYLRDRASTPRQG